jgi:hypothetical protein
MQQQHQQQHHQQQQVQHLSHQNIQRYSKVPSEGLNYNQLSIQSISTIPSYSNTQQYKQELHSNHQYQQQHHQNNIGTNKDSNFDQFDSALPPSHQQLRQYQQNQQNQPQQQQYNNYDAYNNSFSTNPRPHYNQQGVHSNSVPNPYSNRPNVEHQEKQTEGYQFGDFTKGIINKGKKARGKDESSGYKFGDFTRGLFK